MHSAKNYYLQQDTKKRDNYMTSKELKDMGFTQHKRHSWTSTDVSAARMRRGPTTVWGVLIESSLITHEASKIKNRKLFETKLTWK